MGKSNHNTGGIILLIGGAIAFIILFWRVFLIILGIIAVIVIVVLIMRYQNKQNKERNRPSPETLMSPKDLAYPKKKIKRRLKREVLPTIKPLPKSEWQDSGQRTKFPPSKTEKKLEAEMRRIGLNPVPQYQFKEIEKYGYQLDFAFPEYKVDIEVDGTGGEHKHHLTESQKRKDGTRDDVLQSLGWKVRRFTDKEVRENPLSVAYKVKRFLERVK